MHKIFILCAAERMNLQAQNALLKVLEEPQSSVFILLTTARESLLPTVRSRCLTLRMEPLKKDEILYNLRERFPKENKARLEQAEAVSGGYLGQAIAFLSEEENEAKALGRRFIQAFQKSEFEVFRCFADAGRLNREEYRNFCTCACEEVHRLAVLNPDQSLIQLYEYLEAMQDMTDRNASIAALNGAICAVCGRLLDDKEGGNA